MLLSVVIPTLDRRESLIRAVESCMSQSLAAENWEVVVVDNSADGRQAWIADRFAAGSSPALRYVHESSRGLAAARNRGVTEAKGTFVVFLDDDERPVERFWLANLSATALDTNADVTFGPVMPEFETPPRMHRAFVTEIYTRDNAVADGGRLDARAHKLGTGNSCFLARTCFAGGNTFDERFNDTGGEDVELLARLAARDLVFSWAAQAVVTEFVPNSRLAPAYLAARRFRQGQLRTSLQRTPAWRWDRVLLWMAIGAIQTGYHAGTAALLFLTGRREKAEEHRIRAWGGLGKVLWQRSFNRLSYAATP